MGEVESRWKRPGVWVVAILALAAAVRLTNLAWDQTHFFHPDERAVANAVLRLSFRPLQLNPQFFAYGSLPIYLAKLTSSVAATVDQWAASYDGVILNGRRMSAVIGTLTVLVLIGIGRRLYGDAVGVLAGFLLAACALHIQNSRFLTVDVTLSFFVLLALAEFLRVSAAGRWRDFIGAGIAVGCAVATKFSAMPLLLPFAIAALHRAFVERRVLSVAVRVLLGAVMAAAAFAVAQPYALLDFRAFFHDINEQSLMVRNAGLMPYTTQYMGTPKYWYEVTQMMWGMGPLLGVTVVWAAVTRIGVAWRTRRAEEWILLSWVVPFFLISGWFEVKFPRYLLPIYPVVILWAAEWLVRRYRAGGVLGRLAAPAVVIGTAATAAAFVSIYLRPHTVVTASEWAYRHIPAGSRILSQHWDEGFPFGLPGHNPSTFKVVEVGYYEPDNPAKIRKLAQDLAQGDYIVFQTKRLYGAVTRAPQRFPLTGNYFYELFAGDLGYTLVHEVAARPSLFGIEIPDELADESLTVYDHPKVLFFQNTGHLDANTLAERILHGLPSRPLTRDDLLLARPAGAASLETSGAAPPVRSSVTATLLFAVLVFGLSWAVYPWLRRWVPWAGTWAVSKPLGVLGFAYLTWILCSLGVISFTQGALLGVAVALAALGALGWRRGAREPQARAEVVAAELLFWGVFLFFLVVRAFNPEVYWGEKPMDFSFLNALTRATALPPPEPWFAGSPLQYNYFGHYLAAALGKAVHVDPAITFNLAIALFGALTAAAAFAAGAAITGRWGTGVLATCLVVLAGNLAGVREAVARRSFNFDYFWATSRVVKDTINEFPLWSFLFADLHAHVMVMPFTVTFMALTILWVRARVMGADATRPRVSATAMVLLLCLVLGAIMVTNTWSTPTYVLLLPFLVGTLWVTEGAYDGVLRFLGGGVVRVVGLTAIVVAGAYGLFWPFWGTFVPPERNFGWERGPLAPPYDVVTIFGLFLFAVVPFALALWARHLRGQRPTLGVVRGLFVVLATAVVVSGLAVSTRAFAATVALLCLQVLLAPATAARWRLPLALATFAAVIIVGCDLIYVWDRMNTLFKFYLEAWSMFALATAVAVPALWSGAVRLPTLLRWGWRAGCTVLMAVAAFTAVTDVIGVLRTHRVDTPKPTLDGMAYLRLRAPDEAAAYEWLNRNIQGIPVLLEAQGDSYQDFTRVSMNTGLPTVLGWEYHVYQRGHTRPEINERKAEIHTAYTTADKATVADILQRYHVALVYVGPLERRTYNGANLTRFREWTDLLSPLYENAGVTIFAVNGRFTGAMPVTTIEAVPRAESPEPAEEAPPPQDAPGRLNQPRGVAVESDGDLVVCDFSNNRIQTFTKDLAHTHAWGTRGEAPGQFKDPCAVAVGPGNEIYVADTWNQRIQVFSRSGEYRREWSDAFFGPRGIAIEPTKGGVPPRVFVADTGNGRIARYTLEGQKEVEWGSKGDGPGQFFEPSGLAVDAAGKVYVCDNGNGRLQIFTRDGKFVSQFKVPGWESKVYSEPHVALDGKGTIWVTVPLAREVRNYDASGKLLRTITGTSIPGAPFDTPMGIAYSAPTNTLVIADLQGRLVRLPLER